MAMATKQGKEEMATETDSVSSISTVTVTEPAPIAPKPHQIKRQVKFVHHVSNPCCCSLQSGILWIAITEMIIYCIGLGVTAYWYTLVIDFPNETLIADGDNHGHGDLSFYQYQQHYNGRSVSDTNKLIAHMALTQIIVFSINIVLSFALTIAAIRRISVIGTIWIIGICITSFVRLVVMIIAPMYIFEAGLITFFLEMYYMWCVSCFDTECELYPDGVVYYNDDYLPWVEPVEPLYPYGYGYQLAQSPPVYYNATRANRTVLVQQPANNQQQQQQQQQQGGRSSNANNNANSTSPKYVVAPTIYYA